jgi:putative ABC transport system permease protein
MELPTRWIKVLKDIRSNMSRTVLVILSIAVGVAAVGMTTNGGIIVQRDMNIPYRMTNPSSTTLTITPFHKDLARAVDDMRQISQAEARRIEIAHVVREDNQPLEIALYVVPDYENVQINQFSLETGRAIPQPREILLERQTAALLGLAVGDQVKIKLTDIKRTYTLIVAGIVHDMHMVPPWAFNQGSGYVLMDTLVWMGLGWHFNSLEIIVAEDQTSKTHIMQTAALVRDRVVEPAGYRVVSIKPFLGVADPGDHYASADISGMIIIVNVIGIMTIFLTIGLVLNTISALIVRQVQQIGIIRSIGGLRQQISWMYITNVLILSLSALVIALPAGLLGAAGLAGIVAEMVNFDVTEVNLPLSVLLLQISVGLVVPLGAAIVPIMGGIRISVHDAIYQHGLVRAVRMGAIERLLTRSRGLTTMLILSIRNTFRRKTRLTFTLITLTLAGATFMGALSTYTSLMAKFDSISRYWLYDAVFEIPGGAPLHAAQREALRLEGIEVAEGWYQTGATFLHPDGSESEQFEVMAVPPDSVTVDPQMVSGRWLEPDDTNAIVVNQDLLSRVGSLQPGSEVTLHIHGLHRRYQVVGITSHHLYGARLYMPRSYLDKTYRIGGQVNLVRVQSQRGRLQEADQQDWIATRLEDHFEDIGWGSGKAETQHEIIEVASSSFQVILSVLLILSTMLAMVGGLGLAGTMGLNVLERTREIGVLRAVGATNAAIRRLVLFEGVVVASISWVFSTIVSIPFGSGLANAVSMATMQASLDFSFSTAGMVSWLVLVLAIGAVASLAPARRASQLTVREVLAYE